MVFFRKTGDIPPLQPALHFPHRSPPKNDALAALGVVPVIVVHVAVACYQQTCVNARLVDFADGQGTHPFQEPSTRRAG